VCSGVNITPRVPRQSSAGPTRNGWRFFFFYFYLIFDASPHLLFSCLFCLMSVCVCGWERVTQFPHGEASPRDPTVDIFISSSLRNENNQTEKQPPRFILSGDERRYEIKIEPSSFFSFSFRCCRPCFHTHTKDGSPAAFLKGGILNSRKERGWCWRHRRQSGDIGA
jgi:hypothetical protein